MTTPKRPPISKEYVYNVAKDFTDVSDSFLQSIKSADNDATLFRIAYTVYLLAGWPAYAISEVRDYGEYLINK